MSDKEEVHDEGKCEATEEEEGDVEETQDEEDRYADLSLEELLSKGVLSNSMCAALFCDAMCCVLKMLDVVWCLMCWWM